MSKKQFDSLKAPFIEFKVYFGMSKQGHHTQIFDFKTICSSCAKKFHATIEYADMLDLINPNNAHLILDHSEYLKAFGTLLFRQNWEVVTTLIDRTGSEGASFFICNKCLSKHLGTLKTGKPDTELDYPEFNFEQTEE